MRRFAIGDVHGCYKPLRTLIETIDPQPEDQIIFLGDYIDRGPDSRGVVDLVIELQQRCEVITLLGNHEIMLLSVTQSGADPEIWLQSGGAATVNSYGGSFDKISAAHIQFYKNLLPFYETENEIFVHANYESHLAMSEQADDFLFWKHMLPPIPGAHRSGKRVFVGHTPQPQCQIMDLGYLVGIDTYCFGHGCLTAFDLDNDQLIQADYHGHLKRNRAEELRQWVTKKWLAARARMKRKST